MNSITAVIIHVVEVFRFKDDVTLFLGPINTNIPLFFPLQVSILLDGKFYQKITLQGQRMPGDQLPRDYVAVYTDDPVDIDTSIVQDQGCTLVVEGDV